MAGKYALYLPYKIYTATVETATDAEFGAFIRALLKYDIDGTEPAFEDRAFSMLFESIRPELDFYHEKYDATVERRRKAGAVGGASKSDKKQIAARENGKTGGAPPGNRNATKKEVSSQESGQQEEQKQPKQPNQMLGLNEKTTQAESVVSNQYTEISSSSEVVSQPPQTTTTTFFINKCKALGYSVDHARAREVTAGMNPSWLSGTFTYPEYIAGVILEIYAGKPQEERRRLFRALLAKEDRKNDFPAWRESMTAGATTQEEQRRKENEAEEKRQKLDEARNAGPQKCRNCGAAIAAPEGLRGSCPSCNYDFLFNEDKGEWEFHEPLSLSEEYKKILQRRNSETEPTDNEPVAVRSEDLEF